jgi:hypothetical protein
MVARMARVTTTAGLSPMVSRKASRKQRPTVDSISKGPEKMMAFLKARSKSKVSQKELTTAGPKDAESPPMGSQKVQTMAEMTAAESSPKGSAKAQTKE